MSFSVWLFGPAASGKSSLARLLAAELAKNGVDHLVLDEDEAGGPAGPARLAEAERCAGVTAAMLNRAGVACVLARTSPAEPARRAGFQLAGQVTPVYLDCPLEQRLNRDQSGAYQNALEGGRLLPGLNAPFDPPGTGVLRLDTARLEPARVLADLTAALAARGFLAPPQTGAAMSREEEEKVLERLSDLGYI